MTDNDSIVTPSTSESYQENFSTNQIEESSFMTGTEYISWIGCLCILLMSCWGLVIHFLDLISSMSEEEEGRRSSKNSTIFSHFSFLSFWGMVVGISGQILFSESPSYKFLSFRDDNLIHLVSFHFLGLISLLYLAQFSLYKLHYLRSFVIYPFNI